MKSAAISPRQRQGRTTIVRPTLLRTVRAVSVSLAFALMSTTAPTAFAQAPTAEEMQALRSELEQLRAQERERAARIDALERRLNSMTGAPPTYADAPVVLGAAAAPDAGESAEEPALLRYPTERGDLYAYQAPPGHFGAFTPGRGYTVANTPHGSLNISAYGLVRYLNQLPGDDTSFVDHLGRERSIDPRNDIEWHRTLIMFTGWMFNPRFSYNVTAWGVNSTEQALLIGSFGWRFNDAFQLGAGLGRLPGTSTLMGSHPYWYAGDRVMADEFFRPGFTSGVWATGEIAPRLNYMVMVGNNLSQLGITAREDTRDLAVAGTLWWMPTTGEFGPRDGFGDFEHHERLATRFGVYYTHSRENRFTQSDVSNPENTQVRLSDSTLFFETGALAPGVTVIEADYDLFTASAGFKYRGWALHTEAYYRTLTEIDADGPIPITSMEDTGFYAQGSYEIAPRRASLYAGTSWVFGEFNDAHEFMVGLNVYPTGTRNLRWNTMIIDVNNSPVSSLFGFYVGGLDGAVLTTSVDLLF